MKMGYNKIYIVYEDFGLENLEFFTSLESAKKYMETLANETAKSFWKSKKCYQRYPYEIEIDYQRDESSAGSISVYLRELSRETIKEITFNKEYARETFK